MKIAIVGSGISGLVAAHLLARRHEVVVFESESRIGGHTRTVSFEHRGERHRIDTGFIVYNERTYPNFCRLLDRLGVETRASDMSFSVSCERTGVEWGSNGMSGLFAQPRNLFRPSFVRMIRDVLRFNREARDILDGANDKLELGEYLAGAGYSSRFVDHYVVPMGAAIWSASATDFLRFPAAAFVRFFDNHGLLEPAGRIPWRVVADGSDRYIEPLTRPFRDRIRTDCPVRGIHRDGHGVEILAGQGLRERFDRVVMAVHSDQALALLADPGPAEREILSSISYQHNDVTLHTDPGMMPRAKRAWASWNYRVPAIRRNAAHVTYHMNRLQGLVSPTDFFVSLNADAHIDPERVIDRRVFHHPVFDAKAMRAQRLHDVIDGARHTHYCGAWWGWGFHEDGVRSALAVGRKFGLEL